MDVTTVRKTFTLRKTESRMPLLCIPTQRQSDFRWGLPPWRSLGAVETQPNEQSHRC